MPDLRRPRRYGVHPAAGEDFGELARKHSTGPTREAGGDLGRVSRGDMAAEIEKVAFALPAGGISDPMPAPNGGLRILRVVEKTEGRVVPFAEVKDEIVRRMGIARVGEQVAAVMTRLSFTVHGSSSAPQKSSAATGEQSISTVAAGARAAARVMASAKAAAPLCAAARPRNDARCSCPT